MKKFFIIFSVLVIMALSTLTASAISGDGTEESPFLITNQEELSLVTDFPSSHFKLANDIVMNGNIKSLCYESDNQTFTGVFDGNGYTISNLTMNASDTDYISCSLFYNNSGEIKNLNLTISDFTQLVVGGITQHNYGTIYNCSVGGELCGYEYAGGIAYDNYGVIEKCKVDANFLKGMYSDIAGIAVENYAKIEDCYFTGKFSGDSAEKIAGICIENGRGTYYVGNIKNCYVSANFTDATSIYPISCNATTSTMENCYYDKTVSGLSTTTYGTPKSTSAMKMIQTYQSNWDFDTVWGIDSNINNGYPYLLWEYAPTDNQITFDIETQKAKIYLKEAGTYTVIFADYNGTTFVEADIQPLTLKQGYNNIPTTLTLTDGDKVFLWKDLKTLVPICEAANVSLK